MLRPAVLHESCLPVCLSSWPGASSETGAACGAPTNRAREQVEIVGPLGAARGNTRIGPGPRAQAAAPAAGHVARLARVTSEAPAAHAPAPVRRTYSYLGPAGTFTEA